jgi:CelD/BcsL family acetyltransferase involved in cellulose biosynthesis
LPQPVYEGGPCDRLTVRVCRTRAEITDLADDWRVLAERHAYSAAQGYAYVAAALAAWPDLDPAILVARRGDRLSAIWPLAVSTVRGVRVARHIGCGGREEYAPPLLAEDHETAEALLAAARPLGDVLELYNLPPGGFSRAISESRGFKHRSHMLSPVIGLRGLPDHRTWLAGRSASFREGIRYDRRRLGREGSVVFEEIMAPDARAAVDWLFDTKTQWLTGRGVRSSWLFDPAARAMFTALVGRPASGIRAFALRLNGVIVAASICLESAGRLEGFMIGFDPARRACSPGNLLNEDIVGWCIERGLDYDFRLTRDSYKLRWADRADPFESFLLATHPRGVPWVAAEHARTAVAAVKFHVRRRLPAGVWRTLKRLKRGARRP